ncbi:MAG: 50S ribosomal protein L11 methyltransferase, partial [Holophagales bacterium]|nr:50S ribosomal protein L11 methyltransferase [Holophagales bacterium]
MSHESPYSLPAYGRMVADPIRFGAYRRALEARVRPGDVVVDLGAGPGIFALVASRLGVSRVWALEPDAVAEVARDLVRQND